MPPIDLPRLLGERGPAAAQKRRTIRNKLLARRSLAPTDHEAIRHLVSNLLSEAAALRDQLRDNPKDEQKRRLCRALIAEAVYLASDDEGRHVLWLRKMCIDLTGIAKDTPLLPLALKAFGPYDYSGDARCRRNSDKKVSRDYKSIVRVLSPHVLPPDLLSFWNQPGHGINATSRAKEAAGRKQDSYRPKRVSLTAEAKMYERYTRQADGKMICLVDKKGSRSKLQGMVANPKIVKAVISQIVHELAKRKGRAARITAPVAKKPSPRIEPSGKTPTNPEKDNW
jgi:hypothetical protein